MYYLVSYDCHTGSIKIIWLNVALIVMGARSPNSWFHKEKFGPEEEKGWDDLRRSALLDDPGNIWADTAGGTT